MNIKVFIRKVEVKVVAVLRLEYIRMKEKN